MKKAGHGKAPRKSRGARKKNYIKEDSRDVSEEAEQSVVEDENASCAELVKAFKCSTISSYKAASELSTTIENLPEELLINIFIRLLAKQLAKMRAVSKSWNALLSESSFVKSHLHHSIHSSELMLAAMNEDVCSCNSAQCTVHTNPSPELSPTSPVNPQSNRIKVIGAVTGLVCLSSYNYSVISIKNFSLSAVSRLPPFLLPDSTTSQIFLRFGFDPQTDDYKVVKLTGIMSMKKLSSAVGRMQFPYRMKKWLKVEVYSMRKGSWELITASVPSRIKMLIDSDLLCADGHDGHLHWISWCSRGGKTYLDTIVSFDLSSHTFREIPFPDASTLNHHDYMSRIGVLSGKLCVILEGDGSAFEVWVMDESWVKRHVFSLSSLSEVYPFGFTSQTGEFLVGHGGDLVLWDLCANKGKYFDKFCCGKRHHPYKILEYVNSLVWVTPDKTELEGA
ncbi:hypothetical protein LXL04_002249 [Taraxacum kok-saghyz]